MDYLKLAKEQFFTLKEEMLDEDRHSLGAANEIDYDIEGEKFKIKVDGFWEKSTWFDWEVINLSGEKIASGTWY